ncbi:MAG: cyclic nucleotide-binding domain-containing protein [Acidobacteriota bacterium]|nr:cyclic nucleotide-binding domain-containing protein [Acidobacteriota bacterium]MDH3522641.1 cyclic nucleotide-binding domain-containing protein [Acidobacteriota bacterium]
MLRQWLTKLEPVHRAASREELEAVYRFRYTVYYEEYGRSLGIVNHDKRWVWDEEDETEFATILYTGSPSDVTGTVRLRHWPPGAVPEHILHELSMDVLPDIERRHTAEIGRFMIRKGLRGRLLLASFAREAYDLLCGEQGSELIFCYCAPGLVHYYRKLGARPFGGRLVPTPDGAMVPLVSVVSDYDYFRRSGSLMAPLVRRHFGPGKREPVDLEPYLPFFESDNQPVEVDPEQVWGALQEAVVEDDSAAASFADSLPEPTLKKLTERGFIVNVTAGTLVTRQGYGEEEMFIILDGIFEARDGERLLRLMTTGELFGELAFFIPGHRRTASVVAASDGRLLALRGKTLRDLIDVDPQSAAHVLLRLGRIMAERLATGSAPSPEGDGED